MTKVARRRWLAGGTFLLLADFGPPLAGHCCADNVSHIEKYKK